MNRVPGRACHQDHPTPRRIANVSSSKPRVNRQQAPARIPEHELQRLQAAGPDDLQANLFFGLSVPSRVGLVLTLAQGEERVKELAIESGLSRSNASQQLGILWDAGLVARRRRGTEVYYRLVPGVSALLLAADGVLAEAAKLEGTAPRPAAGHKVRRGHQVGPPKPRTASR